MDQKVTSVTRSVTSKQKVTARDVVTQKSNFVSNGVTDTRCPNLLTTVHRLPANPAFCNICSGYQIIGMLAMGRRGFGMPAVRSVILEPRPAASTTAWNSISATRRAYARSLQTGHVFGVRTPSSRLSNSRLFFHRRIHRYFLAMKKPKKMDARWRPLADS